MIKKILGAVGLIAVGLVLFWLASLEYRHTSALDHHALRATVQAPTQYTQTDHKTLGIFTTSTSYSATLQFRTQEGTPVARSMNFSKEILSKFEHQEPVIVEYLPEDTTVVRFVGDKGSLLNFLGFGAIMVLVGSMNLYKAIKREHA